MTEESSAQARWLEDALRQYEQPLIRYALRFTGDVERARDVVQDTFLRLCKADRAKLDGRLAPWLYTVCRNRALDISRKEGRMQTLSDEALESRPGNGPLPSERAEHEEARMLVEGVLAELSDNQREAFRLKFEQGLSYREIGEILDMPHTSVAYAIAAALKKVRARMRTTAPSTHKPKKGTVQ